jgi:hypothetical protein
MRYLIPLVLIIAGLSSCTRYQYITVDSTRLTKNNKHQFVLENDTVRLTYDFNGGAGPVSVNVFNKTTQPLYVNWKKSALIRNERSLSYFNRNVYFSGYANTAGYRTGNFTGSGTDFAGSFALPDGMDFIPPGSSIAKELIYLTQSGPTVVEMPDSITQQRTDHGLYGVKYRKRTYDETGSPIRFKSYLTFTLGFSNALEFAESCDFFVNEAIDTKSIPGEFSLYQQQGDKFFIMYHKQ